SADELVDRDDVAWARRLGDERHEGREIDVLLLIEVPGVTGLERGEVAFALLLGQPGARLVIRGEDRAGRTKLRDHVRDRPALGVAERRDPWAGELEDRAAAAAHPSAAQQLEDHVLRLDPRALQLVLEEDADDLGARQLERVARHADGDVEPTRADRDHRAGAGLGRVAVSADERLARGGEALAVDVVADPVARPRKPEAVTPGHPLQEPVVVRIFEVDLKDVVVDVHNRGVDLDAVDLEELELHAGHRSGRVLREGLVDAERDLLAGDEVAALEVLFEDRAREGGHRFKTIQTGPANAAGLK